MKNNIKFKNLLFKIIIILLVSLFLSLLINIYEYHHYVANFNKKINSIVNVLQDKYPNITEQEIIDILNSSSDEHSLILDKYGLNLIDKSIVIENDKLYHNYLCLNMVIILISFSLLLLLFINYLKKEAKDINDITKYIEELNKRNYTLKIDSNAEDELSILRNEIYKITVMLKETRDISIKDKNNLKQSLEDISHQLKTPITSILIMLDNLIDNPNMDRETQQDFIRDIKRNITNINFLVQSILKLSRFDANTIKFTKEKILVKDIINEANKNVSTLCDLKNIQINIKGNNKTYINGDFMWQVEAITNILKNCVEHSLYNKNIDVYYENNNAYVMITIKDYGPGIDSKDLPHIFERFYKGRNSNLDSIGIGLSLSKVIIEKNNGIINVTSNDTGTKFIIKYFNL